MSQDSKTGPTHQRNLTMPLVTIAIPTFNRAESYLPLALQAALSQSWPSIEILVGDNASTDHTAELIAGIADTSDARRLTLRRPTSVIGKPARTATPAPATMRPRPTFCPMLRLPEPPPASWAQAG